jgi:hypothetical protein
VLAGSNNGPDRQGEHEMLSRVDPIVHRSQLQADIFTRNQQSYGRGVDDSQQDTGDRRCAERTETRCFQNNRPLHSQ